MASTFAKTVDGIGRTNTKIYNENGHFAVQLHSTVVYDEDRVLGLITLNSGGWVTSTTARRMNQALAHRGACPGCGVFDNGNHLGHRYGNDESWFCSAHGSAYPTKKKIGVTIGFKPIFDDAWYGTPNRTCKTCVSSLKRVAKGREFMRRDLADRSIVLG